MGQLLVETTKKKYKNNVSTHRVSVSGGRNSLDVEVIAEELGSHIIDIQNAVT